MDKKAALATLRPSLTKVDIVFSYRSFVRKLIYYILTTMRRHKLKALVVVGCLVAAHKTLGLYRTFRQTFNPLAELQELGANAEN